MTQGTDRGGALPETVASPSKSGDGSGVDEGPFLSLEVEKQEVTGKRKKIITEHLERSEELIGQLYPVLVDSETGEILDGLERTTVDPNWRTESVVVPGDTEEEKTLARLRIKHHANWARKTIKRQDVLTEIAEKTGWRGLKPFAEFLGVSKKTISKYLPQKYKKQIQNVEPSSTFIFDDWFQNLDIDLSLWGCLDDRPEGFGDKTFHGNCSPTIIAAVLKRYSTLEDGLIFDPMAGSGTFIDVAKAVGYSDGQIIVRDIKPVRDDIEAGDAAKTGLPDESIDFIFAHFPYWKMIEYSDDKEDLSTLPIERFLLKSERIMAEMQRILRPGRFFVLMIGNIREGGIVDLEAKLSIMGCRHFTLWDKVVKKIRTWKQNFRGQRMGLAIARARQYNYTVTNHDTLLVFRKEGAL